MNKKMNALFLCSIIVGLAQAQKQVSEVKESSVEVKKEEVAAKPDTTTYKKVGLINKTGDKNDNTCNLRIEFTEEDLSKVNFDTLPRERVQRLMVIPSDSMPYVANVDPEVVSMYAVDGHTDGNGNKNLSAVCPKVKEGHTYVFTHDKDENKLKITEYTPEQQDINNYKVPVEQK